MKDNELRGIVLQTYYNLRRRGLFQWSEVDEADVPPQFPRDAVDLFRICDQLGEHGLIEWRSVQNGQGNTVGGIGKISASGVDVVEGSVRPPISITFSDNQQHIHVESSSNFQIGNSNNQDIQLTIARFEKEIEESSASPHEKAEAKSLLQKISENKLVNTIFGAATAQLTKEAVSHK